jgi:ABC-type branched-subunit amino acid transport system substrate-binding protein
MVMRRIARTLLLALCVGGFAGKAIGASTTAKIPTTAPSDLLLGMSTALSGPAANLGNQMREGVQAALDRANRAGGVNGRLLHLIALDDGYEPVRTAPNMRRLLESENVLSIIGNVGTPTAIAAVPICDEQHALFFAGFTGAGFLRRNPPDRYVINYRASYSEETGAMIDALVDGAGVKPQEIAFFTQRDAYGDAGYQGAIAALKRHGMTDESGILHVRYERNTLAVENALATLLYTEHEPRAIIMVGAYRPCAKFIKLAQAAGMQSLFLNVSFVGSDSLAAEIGNVPANVIVTQVVPSPRATELPIVREYQADMKAAYPHLNPGYTTLEGYVSCRIFLDALARVPGEPTRENVIDALNSMGNFDIGLGEPLHFGPGDHQACHHVWPTVLRDGEFIPFDWKEIGSLLPKPQ